MHEGRLCSTLNQTKGCRLLVARADALQCLAQRERLSALSPSQQPWQPHMINMRPSRGLSSKGKHRRYSMPGLTPEVEQAPRQLHNDECYRALPACHATVLAIIM